MNQQQQQLIANLETAACLMMAPPNVVTSEQRHGAELIFMNFRKSKFPYALCRQILETSKVDYVKFEAAEVLKLALIREWSFIQNSDKVSLRQYIFNYLTTREAPPFVREKLLHVLAIIVKRSSIDDGGKEREKFMQEVKSLILNGEHSKKMLGCSIINNLMQEYATTMKSADVGLPWETHFKAKKQFEKTDMKMIFQFCVQLLSEAAEADNYDSQMIALIKQLITITENILSWGFLSAILPKRLIGIYEAMYEAEQAPSLRLTEDWGEIVFAPRLLPLMFQVYWKLRNYEDLAPHSLNCLVQLASLNGEVMKYMGIIDNKIDYLTRFMENFLKLISSVTVTPKEALGISNLVKKLQVFFIPELQKLPAAMIESYLDELTRLTCSFCNGNSSSDTAPDEENLYSEAFEGLLESWSSIIIEYALFPESNLPNCAAQIFDAYLRKHLAPPEGFRKPNELDSVEIDDDEETDRVKYRDQLQFVGMLGRVVLKHSMKILYTLLESCLGKMMRYLQIMEVRALTMEESAAMNNLFEDIHWGVLVAGHVICMDNDGETPTIPNEIMRFSMECCSATEGSTVEATLRILASVQDFTNVPDCLETCDPVIRVVSDILRFCTIETTAACAKMGHMLSPEVSCTLMWFLNRWCLSYLLPMEEYYQYMSPVIIESFGKDTEGAKFLINFVLAKIQSNIFHFTSEPNIVEDSVSLFVELSTGRQRALHVVKTEGLWNMINFQFEVEPGRLPPNIRSSLYKGFVMAGKAFPQGEEMNNYFERLLKPVHTRFKALVGQENLNRIYHEDRVQKEVVDILECFIGVAIGSQMSTVQLLFDFLAPILAELPALLSLYASYDVVVQMILKLFGHCAKNMLLYLNQLNSKRLYDSTLAVVQAYTNFNTNCFNNESLQEESTFQALVLVLDLLTFILSKDCMDLYTADNNPEDVNVTASDVSLFGLNFIMPLMTLDLLKYPKLCQQFYRLLVLINDIYPEKICNLPQGLLQQLLASVDLGLTQFSSDIVQAALDFIQGIALYVHRNKITTGHIYEDLKPFLKRLLDLTLYRQINSDLINFASPAIYTLICCYQEEFHCLVRQLVAEQTDPLVADRLSAAFQNLCINVPFTCERVPKTKFRDNFERFAANVHGFLLIK